MNFRHPRAAVVGIWGLVLVFAFIQVIAWTLAEGTSRTSTLALQFVIAWVVILVLAVVSTRRIGGLAQTITQHEQARTATLDQVEQLEMRNAILQIISRSVDVPLAFQALAQRIVRLVPAIASGLRCCPMMGREFQTYTARVNQVERRSRPRPDVVFKADRTAHRHGRAIARTADHQRHERARRGFSRRQRAAHRRARFRPASSPRGKRPGRRHA